MKKFDKISEFLDYLYALPNLHPKSDLSYIKRVLAKLDNPQDKVKTIHITGTNGKGSTSYYISNLLKKAGQKTGLFVSPYIKEFNERIQINGKNIPDSDLIKLANQVVAVITEIQKEEADFNLVTFEFEVVMAFLYFAKQNCDYAVIEVGIGARRDKTNVIVPQVSVITTIGFDHEAIIGPTLADIAKEKAGIIKEKTPIVLGNLPEEILPIVLSEAKQKNAPVYLFGQDFKLHTGSVFELTSKQNYRFNLRPQVEGYDIALSVKVFELLNLHLSKAEIEAAINETQIPGRYQVLQTKPQIILDGAHNIQAIENLLAFVRKEKTSGRVYVLLAMMKDKDITEVLGKFKDEQVLLTTLPYPRTAKLADYHKLNVTLPFEQDYWQAYLNLKQKMQSNDILVVTGSFYLVSAILNKGEQK